MLTQVLADFADWTITTARYPEAGSGSLSEMLYLVLGLGGEVGECLNARKKMIRDGAGVDPLIGELADVLWYACRLACAFDIPIDFALDDSSSENVDEKIALSRAFSLPLVVPTGEGSGDLDERLLLLCKTTGWVAEVAREAHHKRKLPAKSEWANEINEVIGLAVSVLVWLGQDIAAVLTKKQDYLLSRTDQGRPQQPLCT